MDDLKKVINTFARINLELFPAIALLIVFLLVTSCATTSRHISSNSGKEVSIIAHKNIIIMPAILKYESISNDAPLPQATYKCEEAGDFLVSHSAEILSKGGFGVLNAKALSNEDSKFKTAYNIMLDERINLFRSSLSTDLANYLKAFGESSNNANILVLLLRVKVGSSGTWDPFSGAITSGSSYTRLKAVLVETKSGRSLWKNEVQLREIPKPDNPNYKKAVNLLFENLKTHKGG